MNDFDQKMKKLVRELAEPATAVSASEWVTGGDMPSGRWPRSLPWVAAAIVVVVVSGIMWAGTRNDSVRAGEVAITEVSNVENAPQPGDVENAPQPSDDENAPQPSDDGPRGVAADMERWLTSELIAADGTSLGPWNALPQELGWLDELIAYDVDLLIRVGHQSPGQLHLSYDPRVAAAIVAAPSAVGLGRPRDPGVAMAVLRDNGYVVALSGPEAMRTQRPSGSVFTIAVLAAAFSARSGAFPDGGIYTPETEIDGTGPCTSVINPTVTMENFGGGRGSVNSIRGLTTSSSVCGFLRLEEQLPPSYAFNILWEMADFRTLADDPIPRDTFEFPEDQDGVIPTIPSLSVVNPSLTALQAAIMAGTLTSDQGRAPLIHVVAGLGDWSAQDDTVFGHFGQDIVVLIDGAGEQVIEILKANVTRGTGTAARIQGHEAWGKTGSVYGLEKQGAENFSTAWFVGGVGDYVAAVWVGYADEQSMTNVGGLGGVTGGSFPAQIWRQVMTTVVDPAGVPE
jgi:hypothetical protein